jgi:flagellar motor switch protein FliG
MKFFTERQRNEVMVRIATLDGIQPGAEGPQRGAVSKVLAGGEQACARRRWVASRRPPRSST